MCFLFLLVSHACWQVYLVSRHGIREPSSKLIRKSFAIKSGSSSLPWLKAWKSPFAQLYADDLVTRGIAELRAAGRKLRLRLNATRVSDKTYEARSTAVRRAGFFLLRAWSLFCF